MLGLYAIVDVTALERCGLEPLPFADAALSAHPTALQLRDKRGHARETLELMRGIAALDSRGSTLLIGNDRPDLAALAGWDGVHVGQDDLPPRAARQVLAALGGASMRVGMSVHSDDELEVALEQQPDYLALGPVHDTGSKQNAEPTLGLDGLRALAARARARSELPLVAIGGIDAACAAEVARTCPCVALIGALLPPPGCADRYQEVTRRGVELGRLVAGAAGGVA